MSPQRGIRRTLWIPLAVALAVVLVAGSTAGGYALGRLGAAARQPATPTVATPFVHFQLAPGWYLAARTSSEVGLRSDPNGYIDVQTGNARQPATSSDSNLLRGALYGISQNHLRGSVGTCLPVTRVRIGGKAGEEVGFLFHEVGTDGTTVFENCKFVWVDVQGSRYYYWSAFDTTDRLPELMKAMRAMQRTAVWSR